MKTNRKSADKAAASTAIVAPSTTLVQPVQPDALLTGSSSAGNRARSWNRWRERYNPLRGLNISRCVTLLEQYARGEMADPQWVYFFIEQADPDLFAIIERREAALLQLDWNIKTVAQKYAKDDQRAASFDEGLAAEQQQALREAYEGIDNLEEAWSHLQLATFRGYAHCEKHRNADGDIYHLEIVDQWNMVRDLLRGKWKYNPEATATTFAALPAENLLDPADFLIRERDRHVNRLALLKFIRANLADKDWDAFIEIFGIPSGVIIGPPGVQPGKEDEYKTSAQAIAEGGSGYLPNGSLYVPNDSARGISPFRPRLDYLTEKLVLAGTGGLLTMLAQSGSGTLAGGAHQEAFDTIAAAEAMKLSAIFQRSVDAEILERDFPGQPKLAYFEIAANEELDPESVAVQIGELRKAGYKVEVGQASERTGYDLIEAPLPEVVRDSLTGAENGDAGGAPAAPKDDAVLERQKAFYQFRHSQQPPIANRDAAPTGADSPAMGRLLATARDMFPAAIAKDMQPLRTALATVLHGGDDATMMNSASALAAKMREPDFITQIIGSSASSDALFTILSAAAAQGIAMPLLKNRRPVMANAVADEGGHWVTIHGSPIFIKDGQSADAAISEHFGGKNAEGKGSQSTAEKGTLKDDHEQGKHSAGTAGDHAGTSVGREGSGKGGDAGKQAGDAQGNARDGGAKGGAARGDESGAALKKTTAAAAKKDTAEKMGSYHQREAILAAREKGAVAATQHDPEKQFAEGGEHHVERSEGGDRVIKHTKDGMHGFTPHEDSSGHINLRAATPDEYMDRQALQEKHFPTDLKFEGAQANGGLTYSQKYLPGDHPTQPEVDHFMSQRGFQKVDSARIYDPTLEHTTYFHAKTGILVGDAKPANLVKTEHGIVPHDLIITKVKPGSPLHKALTK